MSLVKVTLILDRPIPLGGHLNMTQRVTGYGLPEEETKETMSLRVDGRLVVFRREFIVAVVKEEATPEDLAKEAQAIVAERTGAA